MKKHFRRIMTGALSLAVAVTFANIPAGNADAAVKKPSMTKKITVKKGKKATITVKNISSSAKVKWSVNKKDIVKLKGSKKKAVITGRKPGKAVVKAAVTYKNGKKTKKVTLRTAVTVKGTASGNTSEDKDQSASQAPAGTAPASSGTSAPAGGSTAAPAETASAAPEETASALSIGKDSTKDVVVDNIPQKFTDLTSAEIIKEMGTGWNLGNTFDAWTAGSKDENGKNLITPSETAWQQNIVKEIGSSFTKKSIKHAHDLGFNTIRIPVTWGSMINSDYSINEKWIKKVQQAVDYAQDYNMYTIINIHHDGMSDHPGENDPADYTNFLRMSRVSDDPDNLDQDLYKEFAGVWKTIAERFKNYDEHLIFEDMNEVYLNTFQTLGAEGTNYGWATNTNYTDIINTELKIIENLNQIFVDTVRATGSNNAKRWLVVPTVNTNITLALDMVEKDKTLWSFQMPEDKTLSSPRLMLSIHDYDTMTVNSLDESNKDSKASQYKSLKEKFIDNGYPVIIGEYGPHAMTGDYNAQDSNYKTLSTFPEYEIKNYLAKKYGLTPVAWDIGNIVDRTVTGKDAKDLLLLLMRGYYADNDSTISNVKIPARQADYDTWLSDVKNDNFKSFTLSDSEVTIPAGSKKTVTLASSEPSDAVDALIWYSSDESVATVSNGIITANAPGTCTLTAHSIYSEDVKQTVSVTVTNAENTGKNIASIKVKPASITLYEGEDTVANVAAVDADGNIISDYKLSFTSSNPDFVTVSRSGHVTVLDNGDSKNDIGDAVITITSTDGSASAEIPVEVVEPKKNESQETGDSKLLLALNVYTKDSKRITGKPVQVNGDGTYTVKVDTSDIPSSIDLTDFNDVASVYITDSSSAANFYKSAEISYSSIKVNGTELNLNSEASTKRSPYKDGTTFDTGTPLNAWDGVYADDVEIDTNNYTLTFNNVEKPYTSFEVTFTLTGIE